jgi:hypothetical protein
MRSEYGGIISLEEETRPETPFSVQVIDDARSNGRLSYASLSFQPENVWSVDIVHPLTDLVQDTSARPV